MGGPRPDVILEGNEIGNCTCRVAWDGQGTVGISKDTGSNPVLPNESRTRFFRGGNKRGGHERKTSFCVFYVWDRA